MRLSSSMTDFIDEAISGIEVKIKGGKLKINRIKPKSEVAKKVDKKVAKVMNDTVPIQVRKKINKEVRKDMNPAKGAHNIVADTKVKLSKEIGKDLGLEMT